DRRRRRRRGGCRTTHAPTEPLAMGRLDARARDLVTVTDLASRTWVAPARSLLLDRVGQLREFAAAVGADPVPVPAGEPGARPGLDRRSSRPAPCAPASAIPAVLRRLAVPAGRVPGHRRQALLPRRDVPRA